MVAEAIVVFCGMTYESILNPIIVDITPYYGNLTHVDNLQELLFLTCRLRQTECGFYIALKVQTSGNTVTGNCETSINLRRKLPTEH
jgi:hypothetical protein